MTQFYEKPDSHYTPHGWMDQANCTLYAPEEWDALPTEEKRDECASCPVKTECRTYFKRRPERPPRRRIKVGDTCRKCGLVIFTEADLRVKPDGRSRCAHCARAQSNAAYMKKKEAASVA